MRVTQAKNDRMSPTRTGCLKTNWLTATVARRPSTWRAGTTEPARSTWAMTQPPKMSPLALQSAGMGITMSTKTGDVQAVLVVPVALLLAYGLLRLSTTLFTELRELVFAKATEGAARRISLEVFRHLHALSLRFHLERQTGGMTRDIERG